MSWRCRAAQRSLISSQLKISHTSQPLTTAESVSFSAFPRATDQLDTNHFIGRHRAFDMQSETLQLIKQRDQRNPGMLYPNIAGRYF